MRGKRLISISFIMILITLITRILGFIREEVIAYFFGTTFQSDAIKISTYIPLTISHLLVAGLLSAIFIPVFTDFLIEKKEKDMWETFNILFNVIGIIFVILSFLFFIFSKELIHLMAPHASEEMKTLANSLFLYLIPQMLILAWASLFSGFHNTYESFIIPGIGGVLYNISIVASLIFLTKFYGPYAIIYGAIIGAILQLLIQVPFVIKKGWKYKLIFNLKNQYVRKIGILAVPILINSTFGYITPIFEKSIGSYFGEGAISSLDYAFKVSQLPLGIFAFVVSLIIFPTLSQLVSKKEFERLSKTIQFGLKFILYLMIPSSVGLILFSYPIIRLLFEQGMFTENATKVVSSLLIFYSIGLPFWGMTSLLVRVYYSFKDTITPVIISIITIIIQISLYLLNSKIIGLSGIPLGASLASIFQFILLFGILFKKLKTLSLKEFLINFIKISAYSLIATLISLLISNYLDKNGYTISKYGQLMQVGIVIFVTLLIYFSVLYFKDYKSLKLELDRIRGGIDEKS
ncbi:MAG: murein biosynthesis integral membrane protein MurJ [Caldisericia bacterium]|nr:murein biosynthesis integral membrane protein MurJ [Caldisericia bacterium]